MGRSGAPATACTPERRDATQLCHGGRAADKGRPACHTGP